MTPKLFFAGILAAVVMFAWSAIAHMFTPLGEAGISEIPNEAAVTSAMESSMAGKSGLYIFPGAGLGPDATRQQKDEAMQRMSKEYETKSSGLLMYNAPGRPFTFGKWLGIEFLAELIEALLIVWLLAQTRLAGFGARVCFVTVAGILAAFATNISYWNWYAFPAVYTVAYMTIQIVGFLLAGIVAAFVLKKTVFGSPA